MCPNDPGTGVTNKAPTLPSLTDSRFHSHYRHVHDRLIEDYKLFIGVNVTGDHSRVCPVSFPNDPDVDKPPRKWMDGLVCYYGHWEEKHAFIAALT